MWSKGGRCPPEVKYLVIWNIGFRRSGTEKENYEFCWKFDQAEKNSTVKMKFAARIRTAAAWTDDFVAVPTP